MNWIAGNVNNDYVFDTYAGGMMSLPYSGMYPGGVGILLVGVTASTVMERCTMLETTPVAFDSLSDLDRSLTHRQGLS